MLSPCCGTPTRHGDTSTRRQFSWTYLESVAICVRRSPDLEPCFRTYRCAEIHAMRVFVDSWRPTTCRPPSDRCHSAGYSTLTASPPVPPDSWSTGRRTQASIVLPKPTRKKQRHTMWTSPRNAVLGCDRRATFPFLR